jgi:hypothetical protein
MYQLIYISINKIKNDLLSDLIILIIIVEVIYYQ